MPLTPTPYIWMDGEMRKWEDATVHILSHTLHYGSGAFEGIRAYKTGNGPAIFRLKEHIDRLIVSSKILMVDVPYKSQELCDATVEVVKASGLDSCYIRPLVYLGYGEMGLNPLPSPVNVAIACWSWGTYLGDEGMKNGIKAAISSWRRMDPNVNPPAAKGVGLYVNSSMAKIEAIKSGYDEAIMLNSQGYVSEGTGENLFAIFNGVLVTPPLAASALDGITRNSIIKIAKDNDIKVEERNLVRSDLYIADEIFVVGTAAEVVGINSVDERLIGYGENAGKPGTLTKFFQKEYSDVVSGKNDRYLDWLTFVK